MFHSERSFKDFLLGLAVGGSLGALFNTKNGKKVQKEILSRYHQMSKKAHHFLKEGIDKIRSASPHKASKAKRKKRRR
jgi:hypothetical protein